MAIHITNLGAVLYSTRVGGELNTVGQFLADEFSELVGQGWAGEDVAYERVTGPWYEDKLRLGHQFCPLDSWNTFSIYKTS